MNHQIVVTYWPEQRDRAVSYGDVPPVRIRSWVADRRADLDVSVKLDNGVLRICSRFEPPLWQCVPLARIVRFTIERVEVDAASMSDGGIDPPRLPSYERSA